MPFVELRLGISIDRIGPIDSIAHLRCPVSFRESAADQRTLAPSIVLQASDMLAKFRSGGVGVHQVYEWWDCCLIDDMLSEEGNAFAMHYFDFASGRYIHDYITTLQRGLPTEFHVDFTEENYQAMKRVIDRRYEDWKKPKRKWWPFG